LGNKLAPLGFEESFEQSSAFCAKYALRDFDTMIQEVGIGDLELAADASETKVARSEDEPSDASVYQRTRAHGARFQRDIESRTGETVFFHALAGHAQDKNLGVRRWVVVFDRRIRSGGHLNVIYDEYSTNRNFTPAFRFARKDERSFHPAFVRYMLLFVGENQGFVGSLSPTLFVSPTLIG